jgi:hypothetical protein
MIVQNPNSLCKQAEIYYYDFLCTESRGLISDSINNHIEQCQHCLEQINKLKIALSQVESLKSDKGQVSSAMNTMLKLHFAYIGKPVTCNIVKPFLPSLLVHALGMSIPTPIVTHLHNCQRCSEDLDTIQSLNLDPKQLCRLSQLFAEEPVENNINCSKTQNAIPSVARMIFSETGSEVLEHLCKCSLCRKLLYEKRQKICESLPKQPPSQEFPCDSVSASDIFDYCIPYGIDPADDKYAKLHKSFTSHVANCPDCLAKTQQLHKTIYNVAERAESDIVTIFHIDDSAKAEVPHESDDIYAGFPIRVETANREDEVKAGRPASTINFGTILKQKVSAMNLKPLVKSAIAAAAVILIAAALLLHTPAAEAVTIEKIYKALEKVKNVYISKFVPDRTEPIQEKWVSRELDIYAFKTGNQLLWWDITNRVRKIKNLDTATIETIPLTDDIIVGVEQSVGSSFGIMPFQDISEIPEGAQWVQISKEAEALESVAEETEAYDLTWIEKVYGGPVVFKKWRVFVDPETNLPQRTELYQRSATDSEYTLRSVRVVEYLSNSEIQSFIREVGF